MKKIVVALVACVIATQTFGAYWLPNGTCVLNGGGRPCHGPCRGNGGCWGGKEFWGTMAIGVCAGLVLGAACRSTPNTVVVEKPQLIGTTTVSTLPHPDVRPAGTVGCTTTVHTSTTYAGNQLVGQTQVVTRRVYVPAHYEDAVLPDGRKTRVHIRGHYEDVVIQ